MESRQDPFDFLDRVFEKPDWYLRSFGTWKRYVVDHSDFLLSFHSGYFLLSQSEGIRFETERDKLLGLRHECRIHLLSGFEANRGGGFEDFKTESSRLQEEILDCLQNLFEDWRILFVKEGWDNDHSRGFARHVFGEKEFSGRFQETKVPFESFAVRLQESSSWLESQFHFEETWRTLVLLKLGT